MNQCLMQTKLGEEPRIRGHYWGNLENKCELLYSELGEHVFIHVELKFKRFWLEIHIKGSVTSVIVVDLKSFWKFVKSKQVNLQ